MTKYEREFERNLIRGWCRGKRCRKRKRLWSYKPMTSKSEYLQKKYKDV